MGYMTRHLVYAAILEDCLLLASSTEVAAESIRSIVEFNLDFAHLGNTHEMETGFFEKFRQTYRENLADGYDPGILAEQAAFLVGRICREATEEALGTMAADREQNMRQEAQVFRAYYMADGAVEGDMALAQEDASWQASAVLQALLKRAVMRTHTFKPGYEDIHTWLGRFYDLSEQTAPDIGLFAELLAALHPDPSFFTWDDPLLALVKTLRNGGSVDSADIGSAITAKPICLYGKALRLAYDRVRELRL